MSLTVHDISMNADLFKRAYPRWPSAETDPLAGPFMSRKDLTDYPDEPGWAILPTPERDDDEEG
jgi:hypothetical protein